MNDCISIRTFRALSGVHPISSILRHEDRVSYLYGLEKIILAMFDAGWVEHTSDWDITITFIMKDGSRHECDGFSVVCTRDKRGDLVERDDLRTIDTLRLELNDCDADQIDELIDEVVEVHISK